MQGEGLLTLDRTSSAGTTVPLLYSALLGMGGGFFSQTTSYGGQLQEIRGEGQLGIGLPRLQWRSLYLEWDYDYLQHWLAKHAIEADATVLQREHRIAPSLLFALSPRWSLGLFGFYSWVLQGKRWSPDGDTRSELFHGQALYPWIAYAWHDLTQSIFYGIGKKSLNSEDPWLSEQTWDLPKRQASVGFMQEFFWNTHYLVLQVERRYFRCNDFWQDRKEDWKAVYAEWTKNAFTIPILIGWAKQTYVYPRIRMQQMGWRHSQPTYSTPTSSHTTGSLGVRWHFLPVWWMQGEVRSTYDTMTQTHNWAMQLSLSGSIGRALEKRMRREKLLHPFSDPF